MIQKYDIIIIGAGSGGLNVASFMGRLGMRVLIIDKTDNKIGGDCLNTGCVPSKALIHIANQVYSGRQSERFMYSQQIDTNTSNLSINSKVDMKKVKEYIRSKQDDIRKRENSVYLKARGIDFIAGEARFTNNDTVSVKESNGNTSLYTAKNIILATGSRARKLSVSDDESVPLYNNENIFEINTIPDSFVFIGGGPINCELGQAFSRLGSKVTILNSAPRLLEKETENASMILEAQFISEGINVINDVVIISIKGGCVYYKIKSSTNNKECELKCDGVFVGIGRELNLENLDLEKGGVKVTEKLTSLIIDKYLRTTNKRVYVVGDVAGNYQFTHAAEMHAKVVIKNMFSPFKSSFDDTYIAWTTYTSPEISTFGLSEKRSKEMSLEVIEKSFEHDDRAIVDECQNGLIRLYIDRKARIHGGTVIGSNAGAISSELVLAMTSKIGLDQMFKKVTPYPSVTRIIKSIIDTYTSRKLTLANSRALRLLYKIL